ncbi:MAG: hypothetical protein U0Z53_20280 [Blastocatellia bacterium]
MTVPYLPFSSSFFPFSPRLSSPLRVFRFFVVESVSSEELALVRFSIAYPEGVARFAKIARLTQGADHGCRAILANRATLAVSVC